MIAAVVVAVLGSISNRTATTYTSITASGEEPSEATDIAAETTDNSCDFRRWALRSRHFSYGMREFVDRRHNFMPDGQDEKQPGISLLVREGFVIGHVDRFKTSLWVPMKWTREDLEPSLAVEALPRYFRPDPELPEYARASPEYRSSETGYDRGHMARHADNRAWGRQNSDADRFMSNIAPQRVALNRRTWLSIEDAHRSVVGEDIHPDIDTVWIISGCIYEDDTPVEIIANDVAVPHSTFKVIAWYDVDDAFQARGYNVYQEDAERDPTQYLTTIAEIEVLTGLSFFPTTGRG